jgi:hypothetical protein
MRKVFVFVVLLLLLLLVWVPTGCTDKKPAPVDTLKQDSTVVDTTSNDSTENVIASMPMPKAADELFDDFIFNFAANRRLQMKRIVFPLPVYRNDKLEKTIDKKHWRMEHFFMHQEYYTLILDNEKQKELVKDTTLDHVVVEKIFFKMSLVQQFVFNRIDGLWKMTSIVYKPLYKNKNASFLKFYKRFSVDSAFQVKSMAPEVAFTAPDPDDDFSSINGVIMPEQWPDFKPGLIPSGVIYNIIYGQKYTESNRKIFLIRGIANGLEIEMVFKKMNGEWKLVKFNS